MEVCEEGEGVSWWRGVVVVVTLSGDLVLATAE